MKAHRADSVYYTGFRRPELCISGLLMCLGLTVMTGWLLHVPIMVEIKSGTVPMVFNTALCFFLSGLAFALLRRDGKTVRCSRYLISGFLMALCSLTFMEAIFDASFGVDLAFLHVWHDYGNTRPGRMAPNTALGFILIGCTVWLANDVKGKRQAFAVATLSFAVLAVGLTGLVGYFLAPDLLFGWARSARMAIHTATAMILCATGFWLTWARSDWYASKKYIREDDKIRFLGFAILTVVTLTAGQIGFVLLQQGMQKTLEKGLEAVVKNRVPWFKATVDEASRHAATAARLAGIDEAGRVWLLTSSSAANSMLSGAGEKLVSEGFRGIALLDQSGTIIKTFGKLNAFPEIAASLNESGMLELVWDNELILRTRLPVMMHGGSIGSIAIDQPVAELSRSLFNVSMLGSTGEIETCVARKNDFLCFPGSSHISPFSIARRGDGNTPLVIEPAIAGKSGNVHSVDYRGTSVIAAYGPLAPGFGMVVKQDTEEAYAVIRESLTLGAPIIIFIALVCAFFLHSRLRPLAARMLAAEEAASEKEMEMRTVMEAAGDGIMTLDEHGTIISVNAAICNMFGYTSAELTGEPVAMLMPAEMRSTHLHGIAQYLLEHPARMDGQTNMEVVGMRKGSDEFPLELIVNEVPLSNRRLFVGIMRDITERKEIQRKLVNLAQYDSLTGLPNRSLFIDRLSTAVLRTGRSGRGIALMFLDLDGFKNVNDTLGHQAGDQLLIQFAQRISSLVRKTDTVGRLAGDEFTVLLEGLSQPYADAPAVANKIIASMQAPFVIDEKDVKITVSVGLVIHGPGMRETNVSDLLMRADKEMYEAKRAGKNALHMAV